MTEKIGVGIVGASTSNPGWAIRAHLPAIRACSAYELRAVATSRHASAQAAAKDLGIPAYDDAGQMLRHPGIDLVVVAVKVPEHYRVVRAGLEAGKAVFCEWPLAVDLREARELATLAQERRVRTAIGLQARFSPAIEQARELVANGYVGEVLATTFVGSGIAWSGVTDRAHEYMFDASRGASVLSVPTLHALDSIVEVLGEFSELSATGAVRRPDVRVQDTGGSIRATACDHIAITGRLRSGAVVSLFNRGGVSRGQNLYWEINGTAGDLALISPVGNIQVAQLTLNGGRDSETSLAELYPPSGGLIENVSALYRALADDLRNGTHQVPGFPEALRRHELIDTIEAAIRSGASRRVHDSQ